MISSLLERYLGSHLWALIVKETREILRNKYLVFLLLVPPTIQLLILGAALDPQVRNLRLGIVDYAHCRQSRDLITALTATGVFPTATNFPDQAELARHLEQGKIDVGVVIPPEFVHSLHRGEPATVQILIDGADAYTSGIASSYMLLTISKLHPDAPTRQFSSLIDPQIQILYNPGQLSSWYFVPGVLGAALTLTSTLVASASILRERESGTLEQLLMTPAQIWEILMAKVIPIVVFLLCDVCFAVIATQIIFGLPFRGHLLLLLIASLFYLIVGIGLGMLLGSVCQSQRQAQLASFFINIPLILLSGTIVPIETMPAFFQAISMANPLRYYAIIARSVILKGAGLESLWTDLLFLAISATVVLCLSANRFRKQCLDSSS